MIMVDNCPFCGNNTFVEGVQNEYAVVTPSVKKLTFKAEPLYHVICLKCGAVVRSYVKNPSRLITKK